MPVSHPFAVLYHRCNVLKVLKVSCRHRAKLNKFIADLESLKRSVTIRTSVTTHSRQCQNDGWYERSSQLHWPGSLGSQHPPEQTEEEQRSVAPSPPPDFLSHPFASWLFHWHAACARPLQSPPWLPYDHSGDLRDKITIIIQSKKTLNKHFLSTSDNLLQR